MLMLLIITLVSGALLGLMFKVFILAPAIGCAFIAIISAGVAQSESFVTIAVALAIATIGLELGFLGGILTRHGFFVVRTSSRGWPQARDASSDPAR
jgi:hypothetical protein